MNAYLHDKHISNHAYHNFMLTKYFMISIHIFNTYIYIYIYICFFLFLIFMYFVKKLIVERGSYSIQ